MTPLVLIPGMMCDARLFAPQIAEFSGERMVVCAAIPQASVAEMAAAVLRDAPPRFALLGLSLGGIVAMEIMAQAPDRVERLALLDTNPKAEHDAVKTMREPQMERVRNGELRDVMRDEMKPNYLADGPNRGAILDVCMAMAEGLGADVFINQSRALQGRADRQDELRKVTMPTLILCGEDDALCPIHRHELMHDLVPNSTLVILDGAGHLPTLEQPEATNNALRNWLEA